MSITGMRVRDSQGNITLDLTDRITRLIYYQDGLTSALTDFDITAHDSSAVLSGSGKNTIVMVQIDMQGAPGSAFSTPDVIFPTSTTFSTIMSDVPTYGDVSYSVNVFRYI